MKLSLIAAHDKNLVIGKDGGLPWHYPEDLKFFKKMTMGKTIIMGRGVFEELNQIPLPGRKNIVLSTSKTYSNLETYHSLEDALDSVQDDDEVFIIGGGTIYRQTLNIADKLVITEIHDEYDGDTFFPEYRNEIGSTWTQTWREDKGELSYVIYERVNPTFKATQVN